MSTEDKLIRSYLIYISMMFVWLVLIWGATGYLVFWRGESGWWFALTVLMSCPISPWKWNRLLTGEKPDED
jgi:hypothetical protein